MTIMRKTLALLLCLCCVLSLFGCQDPTEPSGSKEPAQVKVMTLNVAYYDGIFTNNQHLSSVVRLKTTGFSTGIIVCLYQNDFFIPFLDLSI